MTKKKLSLNTKLKDKSNIEDSSKAKLNLIKKSKDYPRSFRLRPADIEHLETLAQNFSVDSTKVLRAALYLASKTKKDKFRNIIAEAEAKSLVSKINI